MIEVIENEIGIVKYFHGNFLTEWETVSVVSRVDSVTNKFYFVNNLTGATRLEDPRLESVAKLQLLTFSLELLKNEEYIRFLQSLSADSDFSLIWTDDGPMSPLEAGIHALRTEQPELLTSSEDDDEVVNNPGELTNPDDQEKDYMVVGEDEIEVVHDSGESNNRREKRNHEVEVNVEESMDIPESETKRREQIETNSLGDLVHITQLKNYVELFKFCQELMSRRLPIDLKDTEEVKNFSNEDVLRTLQLFMIDNRNEPQLYNWMFNFLKISSINLPRGWTARRDLDSKNVFFLNDEKQERSRRHPYYKSIYEVGISLLTLCV